ncbi:LEA type 2 family protein [Pseudomonas sp. LRF_L74]|uniref:LEA type 2 family protein n=1 Tax=Pseudomonas sp. LRF_L74 TaxID=3369422 RepID=UPI003F647DC2
MNCQAQMIRIIGLSLGLGLLSGCSTWFTSDFQDPEIRLLDVEVIKARLLEQRLNLHFRIDNPNDSRLPVRKLLYSLELDGIPLAEGESREWFTVKAHGHKTFVVPVRTNVWRHLKDLAKALESPDTPIRYRFTGAVQTGLLFGRTVHLVRNGEIIPDDYIPE